MIISHTPTHPYTLTRSQPGICCPLWVMHMAVRSATYTAYQGLGVRIRGVVVWSHPWASGSQGLKAIAELAVARDIP